jgi:hypothetical protein
MNQKDEERLIMDYFKKNYPDFPKGKLEKSESPDFILHRNNHGDIGIEITRLHESNLPKNNPGFPVAELTMENIETSVKHKEEKLSLYRKKQITEFWLIITTDYIRNSKAEKPPDIISRWQINSGFHRVFLFDLFEKKIYSLNIKFR